MKMVLRKMKWCVVAALIAMAGGVAAQQKMSLQDAASRAVLKNPEVLAKWHTFGAAGHERNVSFGGLLPTLDLQAAAGRTHLNDPLVTTARRYSYDNVSLILRQMLYDGAATLDDIKRLDHAKRVRYFELLDISESAALEAVRAYQDVLRYQRLVEYTEENYAQHKLVYDQISERTKKGVSRGVDLETASGRLALAESNLLTEVSNLHDVSARFQRIVGEKPANLIESPKPLSANLPANPKAGLIKALDKSPQLMAAMENIQAAQRDVGVRRAAYHPRVDFRLQHDQGHDLGGTLGRHENNTAEFTFRYNIFNGKRDDARVNQYTQNVNVAKDLRDKVCRDIRQTLQIALNDVSKLKEQINYLDQHQLATDKARNAFRNQFDIGQRTLLDLLDTENEYFTARRAYTNGERDLDIAYARVHAATGDLLAALGVKPVEPNAPPEVEAKGEDVLARCPAESVDIKVVDKKQVVDKALRLRPARPASTP
jgi:adhesin transport system outer membrane protein